MTTTQSYQAADATAIPASPVSVQSSTSFFKPVGPVIAYDPAHAQIAGDPTSGILLGQIAFWDSVMRARHGAEWDGWFYKTAGDWERETGLTRSMQETARAKLIERGLLRVSNKGQVCGKLSFQFNAALFSCLMAQIRPFANTDSQKGQSAFAKSPKRIRKSAKAITENTPEITYKNTTDSASLDGDDDVVSPLKKEGKEPAQAADLLQRLFDKGMTVEFANQCLSVGFEECELQLHRLDRERGIRNPARWLYKAILGRHRDSDAYRQPRPRYSAPETTDAPRRPRERYRFVPQGSPPPPPQGDKGKQGDLSSSPTGGNGRPVTPDREALLAEQDALDGTTAPPLTQDAACDAVLDSLPEETQTQLRSAAFRACGGDSSLAQRLTFKRTFVLREHGAAVAAHLERTSRLT